MKMVIISPHPDDETLGAAGTILKYKRVGNEVYWINVTNVYNDDRWSDEYKENRKKQIDRVCSFFKFDGYYDLGFKPCTLNSENFGDLVQRISNLLNEISPDVLILPNESDAHSDHYYVFKAGWASSKSFRCKSLRFILTMEVLSETNFCDPNNSFAPNYFVDISEMIEDKIQAIEIYDTEVGAPPFPRSIESVKALAQLRGATAGVQYAEGFMVMKIIDK